MKSQSEKDPLFTTRGEPPSSLHLERKEGDDDDVVPLFISPSVSPTSEGKPEKALRSLEMDSSDGSECEGSRRHSAFS